MMLAMHSPVLKLKLSQEWSDLDKIHVTSTFPATFWLMHHLYCGLRSFPCVNVALDVLAMGQMFLITTATRLATQVSVCVIALVL